MFKKAKANFSIKILDTWVFKPFRHRLANAAYIRIFNLEIIFPLPYHENFIYSQGWDAGWRAANGIFPE